MFDIGFWELSLIMIIALLVVGPERLPKMARTIGLWVGKGRQILTSVKQDIDRELKADELKKTLKQQAEVPELHEFTEELNRDLDAQEPSDETSSPQPARKNRDASADDASA